MLSDKDKEFIGGVRHAVLTTYRRDGVAQMSILSVGPLGAGVAFTSMGITARVANLKRDPRCSLLLAQEDWNRYMVLEGRAEVLSADRTDAERLRLALRDAYRAIHKRENPDWGEFDEIQRDEDVVVITVIPERVYGGTRETALPQRR